MNLTTNEREALNRLRRHGAEVLGTVLGRDIELLCGLVDREEAPACRWVCDKCGCIYETSRAIGARTRFAPCGNCRDGVLSPRAAADRPPD